MIRKTLVLALLLAHTGCATEVEQHLLDASESLEECDLRTAHTSFAAAYAADPNHPDAALGFALTDTILLPEDPEFTAGLAQLGFTAPLDTEILWGADGILARLQRDESCESVSDFAEANIPYPPVRDSRIDALDLITPGLTVQQLIDRLQALDARFERLARAYETAADAMDTREVTIEGGCGTGRIVVQAPELYTLAATFVFLRAALAIAPTYDWSILIADIFASTPERNIIALDAYFQVVDARQAVAGRGLLSRATGLVDRAASSAASITTSVPDAVFDWSVMDRTVLSDIQLFAGRISASLDEGQPEVIPFMTPELSMDVSAYLLSPPDQGSLAQPLWSYQSDDFGSYTTSNEDGFAEMLRPYFTPDPFSDTADFQWDLGERWDVDLDPVFDPGGRFSMTYECRP